MTANNGILEGLLSSLEQRLQGQQDDSSYTQKLVASSLNAVAQKVGEEAVEVVIASIAENDHCFKQEVADLLYHLAVLLIAKKVSVADIDAVLTARIKN